MHPFEIGGCGEIRTLIGDETQVAYRNLLAVSRHTPIEIGPSGESRTRNPLGRQSLKLLRIAISATDG